MKPLTSILITALSACVLMLPALSHAATPAGAAAVTVRYADLNLGTAAGNSALYARLVSAARQVCGAGGDIRNLGQLAATQACQREAIANAVYSVHSTQLAAVYARHQGQG
ncbi:MAG TPA: UrcA family protein [Steroidobacteraceae bacterium]|nr:UrcA family protein [Steroidobacteraceae bacterium]